MKPVRKIIVPVLLYALVLLGMFILFVWFQRASGFTDPDAFYHIKMAQLWPVLEFPYLPFTTFGEQYTDHHFLYHLLMVPFVQWMEPIAGIKLLTAALAVSLIASVGIVLKLLGTKWWWVVAVVMAITTPFTFRLNLIKANSVALLCVVWLLWAWFSYSRKRQGSWYSWHTWLVVGISGVFVWAYGGFIIALPLVVLWVLAEMITRRALLPTRRQLGLISAVVVGLGVGLIVHPYFPNNLWFYWEQVVQIGIVNYQNEIGVGSEWYPYSIKGLVLGATVLTSVVVSAFISRIVHPKPWKQLDWFSIGIALLGTIMVLKSRRYIEYYGVFMLLAAGIWLSAVPVRSIVSKWLQHKRSLAGSVVVAMLVIIAVVPVVLKDQSKTKDDLHSVIAINEYRATMAWLDTNAEPYSTILHSDWDHFPQLFYHAQQPYRYMNGLDPTFMYRHDAERYWLWVNITLGKYSGDLTTALQYLETDYIIVQADHVRMYNLINRSPKTELVYSDTDADIFKFVTLQE